MNARHIAIAVASVMLMACGASKPKAEVPARPLPPRNESAPVVDAPEEETDEVSTVDVPRPRDESEDDSRDALVKALREASNEGVIGLGGDDAVGDADGSISGVVGGVLGGPSGIFDPKTGANMPSLGGGGLGAIGTLRIANRADGVDLETRARVRSDATPKKPVLPTRIALSRVVASGVSVDAVSGAFDRSDLGLRKCYEARLERDPKARAKVVFEVGIGKDGRTTGTVETTPSDDALAKCMLAALGEMHFVVTAPAKATVELSLERAPD